ncbi:LCP family protein [Streptomyces sp. H27-D2]|uniref:LCP family protein n=1 Tax=Streptomyces sp. H27-D2 TaxID=3046304 RepID=UPI002DBEC2E9|nr:LCP family protein [Streptomyces sp. H27-D2]MEC4018753.1 LCP family protein [Streptomyces sp. H27-D2]
MRQSNVRGERARRGGAPGALDLGWDDTLYGGEPDGGGDGESDRRRGPAAGSGGKSSGKSGAGGSGRKTKGRIMRWSAGALAVLILGTAGAGYLYYQHLNGNLRKGARSGNESDPDKPEPNAHGQTPLNILMIGSDSRNTKENLKLGGSKDSVGAKPLADVQMLLHVSADRKSTSVVSIPRDTRVEIPDCADAKTGRKYPAGNAIINTTLARGGPGCTLATWQNLTGVYIDHWMMVDFAGVVKMADAVGGVEVCTKQNVWDRPLPGVPSGGGSGLKLKKGPQKIQGETALQWLRTRHAFFSDLGRAQAQHMYMNAMIRELKAQNVFTDSGRLTDLAEAATKSLQVSEEIGSVKKLFDVAMQLKSVPTDRITMSTMPTAEDPQDRNHLVADATDADKVWAMLRDDVPFDANGEKKTGKSGGAAKKKGPAASPSGSIAVSVVNGTAGESQSPVSGRAAALSSVLVNKGFGKASANLTPQPAEKTTLIYPDKAGPQGRADALAVAKALKLPTSSVKGSDQVASVTLVIGADWREGSEFNKPTPDEGGVPKSANSLNGSDKKSCMDVYAPYRW